MDRLRILALAALVGATTALAQAEVIGLLDDTGRPLASAVKACFHLGLSQDCHLVQPGADLELPPDFASLSVEGEDYGTTERTAAEVRSLRTHSQHLAVPRKAALEVISGSPNKLSLYAARDAEFRRPAYEIDPRARATRKVPAGEYIASLSLPGSAPDLQRLSLRPGSLQRLRFTKRPGWSLATRVADLGTLRVIEGATVELRPMSGYSHSDTPPRRETSDALGFALFSGITGSLMEVSAHHPERIRARAPAVTASPGTFVVRQVLLETGTRVRASISLDGRRQPGATCQIRRYEQHPLGKAPPPELLGDATANMDGICSSARLAAGNYVLQVSVPGSAARTEVGVALGGDQDSEIAVELVTASLTGVVTLGDAPAVGFAVDLHSNSAVIPARTSDNATGRGVTDENGEYELAVWSAGDYSAIVHTPAGTPAVWQRIEMKPGENVLDFALDAAGISGVVVDHDGEALEGAGIVLRWTGTTGSTNRVGKSAADGSFSFPMKDSGRVVLEASLKGYSMQRPAEVDFVAGSQPPRLRIVLSKDKGVAGVVRAVGGVPVAGAWVGLFTLGSEGESQGVGSTFTAADGTFEIPSPDSPLVRGFASGPGCPLTVFSVPPSAENLTVDCAPTQAALSLVIRDEKEQPFTGARLILSRDGVPIPWEALATHLALMGLPVASDMRGQLTIAALQPGEYQAYLFDATNEVMVRTGSSQGLIGTFSLRPMTLAEVEIHVERATLPRISPE